MEYKNNKFYIEKVDIQSLSKRLLRPFIVIHLKN